METDTSAFLKNLPVPYDLNPTPHTLDLQFQGHGCNDCDVHRRARQDDAPRQEFHRPPEPIAKQTITRLRLHRADEASGDHHNYFRPRPRLDSAWFQIPKPPRLAYHRERFFAQLLSKTKTGKRQKSRQPRAAVEERVQGTASTLYGEQTVQSKGTGLIDNHAQSRIEGGIAGCKFTTMSTIEAPKRGKSWFRGVNADPGRPASVTGVSKGSSFTKPRLKVIQPPVARPATTVPDEPKYRRAVGTSVICLSPVDDTPPVPEADINNRQQYREMRIMGDIHNRELASMRQELAEVREAIETQLNT